MNKKYFPQALAYLSSISLYLNAFKMSGYNASGYIFNNWQLAQVLILRNTIREGEKKSPEKP